MIIRNRYQKRQITVHSKTFFNPKTKRDKNSRRVRSLYCKMSFEENWKPFFFFFFLGGAVQNISLGATKSQIRYCFGSDPDSVDQHRTYRFHTYHFRCASVTEKITANKPNKYEWLFQELLSARNIYQ